MSWTKQYGLLTFALLLGISAMYLYSHQYIIAGFFLGLFGLICDILVIRKEGFLVIIKKKLGWVLLYLGISLTAGVLLHFSILIIVSYLVI
jgi:hypothetical protein